MSEAEKKDAPKGDLAVAQKKRPALAFQKGHGIYPQTFEDLYRAARIYHHSRLIKSADSVEQVLVLLDYGASIGLSCSQSAVHLAIIGNRPIIWGDMALAIIRRSGLLERFYEKIEQDPKEGLKATCVVKRADYPDERVSVFTEQDAKVAGLWGSTPAWKRHPKRMLQMRARLYALRDEFADLLMGLGVVDPMDTTQLREEQERGESKTEVLVQSIKESSHEPPPPEETEVVDVEAEPVALPPTPNATEEAKTPEVEPEPVLIDAEEAPKPKSAPKGRKAKEAKAKETKQPEEPEEPKEWTRSGLIEATVAKTGLTRDESLSLLNGLCQDHFQCTLFKTTPEQRAFLWGKVKEDVEKNVFVDDLPF